MKNGIVATLMALPVCLATACGADLGDGLDPGAEAPETSAAATADAARHCVSAPDGQATCYASFTEAIAAATGGAIADAPADARDALDDASFTERINALAHAKPTARDLGFGGPALNFGSAVIGIVYKDAGYGGNTWVFTQPYGCNGDGAADFSVGNLNDRPYSDYGFNDAISSFHSYSGCRTVLFEHWYFQGAASNGGVPLYDLGYVGDAMNDRATSILWY
jgi:hypothetical protein